MTHQPGVDDAEAEVLRLLKEARRKSGLPLDFWADFTEGLPYSSLAILCGRSDLIPKYVNSSGTE